MRAEELTDAEVRLVGDLYAATFAGQTSAYSTIRNGHWSAVKEPLTYAVVLDSFVSKVPISSYFLMPDSTTHVAALDIDRDDGYELGVRFLKHLDKVGGVGYIERSRRGCHIWIVFLERMSGARIRMALKALIKEAGLPDDKKIELRPVSDKLRTKDQLDSCLRMPTMPHHLTGKREPLINVSTGQVLGRVHDLVLEIEYCDPKVFEEAAMRAPLPPISAPPRGLRYPHGIPADDESASAILRELWGVLNAQPGRVVRCKAHDDRHASLSILKDDKRAICRSPGCPLSNDNRGRGTFELRTMAPRA